MSQAEELLNSMTDEEISAYLADAETEEHIVIGSDRIIKVPVSLRRIAVEHDHNVETVTFDCPRYWDGLDMSKMKVFINYKLSNGYKDCYLADNVVADETNGDLMHFDWTITRNVTQVKGAVSFLVCIKKTDTDGYEENHWNSELNKEMYVSEGLECVESILEEHPDFMTQIVEDMGNIEEALDTIIEIQNALIGGETA